MVNFINRRKNMSHSCENAPPLKSLLEICMQNILFELSLHLIPQKYTLFNDLISKAYALEKRLLDQVRKEGQDSGQQDDIHHGRDQEATYQAPSQTHGRCNQAGYNNARSTPKEARYKRKIGTSLYIIPR